MSRNRQRIVIHILTLFFALGMTACADMVVGPDDRGGSPPIPSVEPWTMH